MNRALRIVSITGTWLAVGLFIWLLAIATTRQDVTAKNTEQLVGLAKQNRTLLQRGLDDQKRGACQNAAFRLYPDAFSNPTHLQALVDYSELCYRLNRLPSQPEVKLPPVPTTAAP